MKFKWQRPSVHEQLDPVVLEASGNRKWLTRVLIRRGFCDPVIIRAFLDPSLYHPASSYDMPDMQKGVDRLHKAIERGERILVWGDFDVDGQTSTSLLYAALGNLGARVEYHVPVREKESHGIKPAFLQPYLEDGVQVLLSCDTGIAAHDAVLLANSYSVDVIITDHHDCPEVLPPAHALINPKRFEVDHPLSGLPGVGVAFKLIEALYEKVGRVEEVNSFLDLVALGIVADLAIVTEDTRYLLQKGLDALRKTQRVGLMQLMDNARVVPEYLIDEHIGFQIGPRLNAVGRLADANISIPLLTTDNKEQARVIAGELERLNEERKFQTELVFESAVEQIRKDPALLRFEVLVLGHASWHQGVIGIVASRLVELYGKPAILIAMPEGELARGSARSIEGVHITRAIASQKSLLDGYGGHPMAAGLAMKPGHLAHFRKGVSRAVVEQNTGQKPEPVLKIDAEVELHEITQQMAHELELMAPFGPGNPPINLLCKKLRVKGEVKIGKDKAHKKLVVWDENSHVQQEILWWNSAEENYPDGYLDCVIRVRPGYFRGEEQLTITLQDIRQSGVRLETADVEKHVSIIDYREIPDARVQLEALVQAKPGVQVWAEPESNIPNARHRFQLVNAPALVIWSLPPAQQTLTDVLKRVRPEEIYVIGAPGRFDRLEPFKKRFVGLVRYVFSNYEGRIELSRLAAEMGHTPATIQYALPVLAGLGVYATLDEAGVVFFEQRPPRIHIDSERELGHVLKEAQAFRSLFSRTRDLSRFLIMPDKQPITS